MGFGYGSPMHTYRFSPASLPKERAKSGLHSLGKRDAEQLHDCYDRYFQKTHGLMARRPQFWKTVLGDPGLQVVGVSRSERLSGYLSFSFEKGEQASFLDNNLYLRELVYESTDDLGRLLAFLSSQADQIEQIIYNTQDDSFFYLLRDPRLSDGRILPNTIAHASSLQGLGIMYRVIHVPRLFELLHDHNFGGVSCRLGLRLSDSFFPENAGSYTIYVRDGAAGLALNAAPEVTLSMDVADFSSLVMGVVQLRKLVDYGLAEISDEAYLDRLDRLFSGPRPVCLTSF
jgi:predicted acetyltransferase